MRSSAEHGFARTVCACPRCVACCERPGPLAPGDYERIRAHLGASDAVARTLFWASPGAVVLDRRTGQARRIGTVTPRAAGGRCVFQQADGRCGIHAVAPFGCAYFDMHQPPEVYMPRSSWLARATDTPEYQRLRATLEPRP